MYISWAFNCFSDAFRLCYVPLYYRLCTLLLVHPRIVLGPGSGSGNEGLGRLYLFCVLLPGQYGDFTSSADDVTSLVGAKLLVENSTQINSGSFFSLLLLQSGCGTIFLESNVCSL